MIKVIRTFLIFVLVVLLILGTIYNRMKINEVTSKIEDAKLTFQNLQNEEKLLKLSLNEKYSSEELKQRAEALGMTKAQTCQIEYVDIVIKEDIVVNPKSPDTVREAAFSLIGMLKSK